MSEVPTSFPLPSAEEILSGAASIKPLQHDAASLRRFVAQFENTPLSPGAANTLAHFTQHMQDAGWAAAHDTAHHAFLRTHALTLHATHAGLAAEAHTVEGLLK